MRKIFFLLLFTVISSFAQFSEITEFPYTAQVGAKYYNQILDAGEGHLIMLAKNDFLSDSIYISHSYDNGVNWSEPKVIAYGEYFSILNIGTIYLAAYERGMQIKLYISEDNGETWQGPNELPFYPTEYVSLYYSDKFYLLMTGSGNGVHYYTSSDCLHWSSSNYFSFPSNRNLSFLEFEPGNYLAVYTQYDSTEASYVIKIASNDVLGDNWENETMLASAVENEYFLTVRSVKNFDGKYWIVYTKTVSEPRENHDVYYIYSEDGGATWSEPHAFAYSYDNDVLLSATVSGNSPLVTFYSERNYGKIFYGKPGISEDVNYPPYVKVVSEDLDVDYNNNRSSLFVKVKTFGANEISDVRFMIDETEAAKLFDDGMHDDGEANDSVYAGNITINRAANVTFYVKTTDARNNKRVVSIEELDTAEELNETTCVITNGNVSFPTNLFGEIGWVIQFGGEIGRTSVLFDNRDVIYGAGFLLSGYSEGELWANGMLRSMTVQDYIPGNVGFEEENKLYYLKSDEPPFGASWQAWTEAVERGAKFYDGNGDGVYNPVDLNGNGVWDENEDAPDLLGDVTAWCVYNDGVPANERTFNDVAPLGIEIRQTVWTNKTNPDLKNVFFVRYSIYNTGTVTETLDSVYFSVFSDDDVGFYLNDLVGSSPDLLTGYTYDLGDEMYFMKKSPTVMRTLLKAESFPTNNLPDVEEMNTSFIQFFNLSPIPFVFTKEIARNFLLGRNMYGHICDPCNWDYGIVLDEDCASIDGRWMYSGNPVDSVGWINSYPNDQSSMLNIGPFTINSGESVDITVAYHFSQGETSLKSVALGLEKAQFLKEHEELWFEKGTPPKSPPEKFVLYQNYPNPFSAGSGGNPKTVIQYSIPQLVDPTEIAWDEGINPTIRVTIKLYDILGREVATLVDKEQRQGNYAIEFDGSGLSSGVYFYRMRAGDFVTTKKMMLLK